MRMRIGLDMDGVLYSWDRAVRDMIREEFGVVVPQSTSWTFINDFAGKKVWKWLWAHPGNVERMFTIGQAYPGAVSGARALQEIGEVYILTSGPEGCGEPKREWLKAHDIQYDKFMRFDHGESKLTAEADIYIDDNPAVMEDLVTARKGLGVLVDRPWNTGGSAPTRSWRWVRVHGWGEIVEQTMADMQ